MTILIISAVKSEQLLLREHFAVKNDYRFCCKGNIFQLEVMGIGAVNTALNLSRLLTEGSFREVWMIGSCGSYRPEIKIGDLVMATEEINGDMGIEEESGREDPQKFGFAILEISGHCYFHRFPCITLAVERVCTVHEGAFLSVSAVSGCKTAATILKNRYHALVENMEGAAAAHTTLAFGKPFAELRGVSNVAGDRNKANWDLILANRNTQNAMIKLIESGELH